MTGVALGEFENNSFKLEQPPISYKLHITSDQNLADGIFIDFVLLNNSEDDLSVLTWNTPLEGFYSALFIIEDQYEQPVPYQGLVEKRTKPSAFDYQLIRAGGNVGTLLDLSSVYSLRSGKYKIQLNKKTLQVIKNDMPMSICQCQTDIMTFTVS
ncbi:hypothetical protein EKO29_08270 [Colwellia sp. Arc7-635]|uniref:hypothetical protein n=1 Tax=Colwellia sp. Arc7-635 TaxID=2497879 RepID=UPI000F85ACE6|nr:hypothetical protein [Colwellia sp. Arc7-635]AZQ84013.1 hypothetical protein EKO29_08270 [Colwellia sp. Arc7-635]